mmetsp:Transcript_10245/g.19676  ORF Transcript_10245/g.19676 Transcript_10245/m.19676 type:complete len:300 (-) Transcript_10245:161-1060(-)
MSICVWMCVCVMNPLTGGLAYSHTPEHGISLFLARRSKIIHFIRHAEGTHNAANRAYGDDTPTVFSTPRSEKYTDAPLTDRGIQQCLEARYGVLLSGVKPELVVVSPLTRTLQTAHIMFHSRGLPFIVHDVCRERWGRYTCDKRRRASEVIKDMQVLYGTTHENIDFKSFAYCDEDDTKWTEKRETDESCCERGVALLHWLATRPEKEIAVVTHSSFLRHLFRAFGFSLDKRDMGELHRKSGNAELRSVTLALHRGFYPEGRWTKDGSFVPSHPSFRKGKWAAAPKEMKAMHANLRSRI